MTSLASPLAGMSHTYHYHYLIMINDSSSLSHLDPGAVAEHQEEGQPCAPQTGLPEQAGVIDVACLEPGPCHLRSEVRRD